MNKEKLIAIGCDDTERLSLLLSSLKFISAFQYTVISASRVIDLSSIVKSLNPDLIIMCFKNNQQVLSDNNFIETKSEIPLLFLLSKYESESIYWKNSNIIFTYFLANINRVDSFCSIIQSILMLKNSNVNDVITTSFVESALLNKQNKTSEDLSRYVMELDQKTEVLLKVKERISHLYPNVDNPTRIELMSIVNAIKTTVKDTKLWEDFKIYFEQTNPNFLLTLAKKHPDLSSKDLKYCCYLKMNMSNNDITHLLGINQESVRTHKYRLKKKLSLSKEQEISSYLRTVS